MNESCVFTLKVLGEKRSEWLKHGGGAKAGSKVDDGAHLLPMWEHDHNDFCEDCDEGGENFIDLTPFNDFAISHLLISSRESSLLRLL